MHRISKPHGTVMVGITWGGGITRLQHVCHTGAQHSRRHATQHHISSIAVCVYAGRRDPEHARRCTSHMRTVCTLVSAWGGGLVRSNSIEMCLNLTARSTPTEHADGACRRSMPTGQARGMSFFPCHPRGRVFVQACFRTRTTVSTRMASLPRRAVAHLVQR